MRSAVLALPLAALTLTLASCGGDGYPKKPQAVAKAYISTNAGSKCRFLTQQLMETLTQKRGAEARSACRHNVARVAKPQKVTLRDAEVDEHDAEVEVLSDGSEAAMKLVRQGGKWKIKGFAE
jgi:hypothetical protein